jgi:hypothetical protein
LSDIEKAARAAWEAADKQWLRDNARPPRQRDQFQVGELAQALARLAGRPDVNWRLYDAIARDSYEWIDRGEFGDEQVLALTGEPQPCEPYLPALAKIVAAEPNSPYANLQPDARRPVFERDLAGSVRVNVAAIILTRPAVRQYLDGCGLRGAPRVHREWFGKAEAAPASGSPETIGTPPSTANERSARRGPRAKKRLKVEAAMREQISSGKLTVDRLAACKEMSIALEYGVSRDTGRKARSNILSEFQKELRQISHKTPTIDK